MSRRKSFLIDSNQTRRRKPKKLRNRFLNLLVRLLFLRQILKLFRGSVLLGMLVSGVILFIGFSVFSPYFDLKKITIVRDNSSIDAEEVEQILGEFYGKNLLFLSQKDVQQKLVSIFPEFKKIKISERWPSEMSLKIETSPPFLTLLNQETANFFVVSKNGVILMAKPDENLPIVKIIGYEKLILPHQQLTSEIVLKKIMLAKNLFEQNIELPLNDLNFYMDAQELHLISENDVAIWIDLQQPIESQIKKLELSATRIGLYDQPLDHVDLRIPKQIFWAPK